jgi:hypothetical protein
LQHTPGQLHLRLIEGQRLGAPGCILEDNVSRSLHEFTVYFGDLEDPRDNNARHHLHELLLIELCALLCGAEDCSDMALFGRAKEEYLRQCRRPAQSATDTSLSRVPRTVHSTIPLNWSNGLSQEMTASPTVSAHCEPARPGLMALSFTQRAYLLPIEVLEGAVIRVLKHDDQHHDLAGAQTTGTAAMPTRGGQ